MFVQEIVSTLLVLYSSFKTAFYALVNGLGFLNFSIAFKDHGDELTTKA